MKTGLMVALVVLFWGIWPIFEKKLVTQIHPLFAAVYLVAAGSIFVPVYFLLGKASGAKFHFDKSFILWAFLAELFMAAGFILFLYLLDGKNSYWAVATTAAYPVVTLIIGVLFLKERASLISVLGVLLVVSGLIILDMG